MARMIYDYTKGTLEKASHDKIMFSKELKKALKVLVPHEIEKLMNWLHFYTEDKPELKEIVAKADIVFIS